MNTKVKVSVASMAAVLALLAPTVYADTGNAGNLSGGQAVVTNSQVPSDQGNHEWKHDGWSKHGHHRDGNPFHKLNLTDDQKKQMKDIWQKQREAMKSTFEQIKINREALNKELSQPTSDMAKINDLQGQLKNLQAQMLDNHLNSTLEVKKILTSEQFNKYLELKKHMMAKGFHKGERNRGGHWGKQGGCCKNNHQRHHHGNWNEDSENE